MTAAQATATDNKTAVPAQRPSRGLWGLILATVVVLAAFGYWRTGAPDYDAVAARAIAEEQAKAQAQTPAANGLPDATEMAAMVDKLEQRLKTQPDDVQGWAMLGRVQMLLGRHEPALAAYQRALALRKDDARLLTDTAEAMAMKNGRRLAGEPTQLLDRALAADPRHTKALALAGAAAMERADHAAAVRHWEQLLAASPPDAEFVAQVQAGITQARQSGKLPGAAIAAAAPVAAAASAAKVAGIVFLAPALAAKAAPEDTVFIVARAAEGPRVPLAVLRKRVADLPINFTLDDSLAMAPNMTLSKFPKVIVSARISKSGQAMPARGDLSGQTAVVDVGASGLRIEISEIVSEP